jgi:hypothetical protein
MAEKQGPLHAKLLRYRELLRQVDDPAVREALQDLIRLTNEKLNGDTGAKTQN